MKCSACNADLAPGIPACPVCSAPKPSFCTECGAALPQGAKFCPECGTRRPLTEQPASPAEAPSVEAVSSGGISQLEDVEAPLPAELRQKLESVRAELSGERREVAVLFADLSGFTALSERLDPEETSVLMNRLMQQLAEAVHRYEGHVDKFIGDAIMALFGAPVAHENDPERAALAALAMLEVIERHNRADDVPLALRVGINLGEVVAVQMGMGQGLSYTVMGDAVNVASRLEGKATPNTVLVSEAVFRRISNRFTAERLPPLTVKGRSEPVQTYRLLAFQPRERPRALTRSSFVGRQTELEALAGFLSGVAAREGAALMVEAEPGTGKSRLVAEALARWEADALVVEVGFSPTRLPGQLSARVEIFRQLLPEEPSGKSAAERALAMLGDDAETYRSGLEGLAHQADPSSAFEPQTGEDAAVARQNRWVALIALLRAAAANRTVLLLVEDLHWMDEATQEFIELLVPALSRERLGILLTTRPRPEGSWIPAGSRRLVLPALEAAAAQVLLGELLEDIDAADRRDLIRRAEGNPLFLEELARAVSERAQAGLPAGAVPGTLQGLLVSRIDGLSPPVRQLLQMAAVLGARFPVRLLGRMYQLESQPLSFERALSALEEGGFLEVELNGDDRRRFHHALVQEVAYGGLLVRIRKVLHESAARLGEEYYAGRAEAEAPFFAHHYWEAGLPATAAPHLWVAGREAAERYDLAAAERFLQRAAEALEASPEVLREPDQRAGFSETFGRVLLGRGKLDPAEAQFSALESLGESQSRDEWKARGLEHRGRIAWYRGRLDEARSLFDAGLASLAADEGRIAADLHNDLGVVFYYRAKSDEAFAHHERALRLRERLGDVQGMAKSFMNIGNLMFHLRDELRAAHDHYTRALELARAAGDRQMTAASINNLGGVAIERGEWEDALALLQKAARIQEEIGWAFMGYLILQNQVVCEISLGRLAEAFRHLRLSLERGDALLEPMNRVNTRLYLFDAHLRALDDEQAESALAEARRIAAELGVDEQEEEIHMRQGRLLAARGSWGEAARAFAEAESAAGRMNHPPQMKLARAHRCRAEARAGMGEAESCPADSEGRAPLDALITYLNADAEAARSPSPEAARALSRAGDAAAALGEICLARAAFERQAEVCRVLGDTSEEELALGRAAIALETLERALPEELRAAFAEHPRNAALRRRRQA